MAYKQRPPGTSLLSQGNATGTSLLTLTEHLWFSEQQTTTSFKCSMDLGGTGQQNSRALCSDARAPPRRVCSDTQSPHPCQSHSFTGQSPLRPLLQGHPPASADCHLQLSHHLGNDKSVFNKDGLYSMWIEGRVQQTLCCRSSCAW